MKKGLFAVLLVLLFGYSASAAETVEVMIKDYSYSPAIVVVKPGDTVKWTNTVENQHTTTSGKDGAADGVWASKRLMKGESFSYIFEKSGTYPYFCTPHYLFNMKGAVEVKE